MDDASLYHIVYLSASSRLLSDEELDTILATSRANNRARGITGMLLYSDGGFIQVLEGPKPDVMDLYHTIERDARHGRLITLLEGPIEARNFPDWEMGFERVSPEDADLPGFSRFFDDPAPREAFRKALPRPLKLLLSFKENNAPDQRGRSFRRKTGPRLV